MPPLPNSGIQLASLRILLYLKQTIFNVLGMRFMKNQLLLLLTCCFFFACKKEETPIIQPTVISADINTETVWEDVNSDPNAIDYVVTKTTLRINKGLVIKPGVVIAFEAGTSLLVNLNGGFMQAVGTVDKPIRFTGKTSTRGFWKGILVNSADLRNELSNCVVEYAGGGELLSVIPTTAIGVVLYSSAAGKLKMHASTVQYSGGYGLVVTASAELPEFSANTFKDNTSAAVQVPPSQVGMMDQVSSYSDNNGFNGVEIISKDLELATEQTWKSLPAGAKYRLLGNLKILSGLRIQPGVQMEVNADATIRTTYPGGYFIAEGTVSQPIVFEGVVKQAGFWRGLVFISEDIRNSMQYCTIAHGGGGLLESGLSNANVGVVKSGGHAGHLTIKNCEIKASAGCGISATTTATLIQSGNTFSQIAVNEICQ